MNSVYSWLISLAFERIPVLRLLNGKKRLIGNILLVATATLVACSQAMAQYFPGVDITYLTEVIGFVGFLLRVVGDIHADVKTASASTLFLKAGRVVSVMLCFGILASGVV